jgi:hypothetical protein
VIINRLLEAESEDFPERSMSSNYSKLSIVKRWVFLLIPCPLSTYLFRNLINNHIEQNKLEAAKFVELATLAYGSNYYFSSRFLNFPFELGQINIDGETKKYFFRCLHNLRRAPELRKKLSLELTDVVRKIPKNKLDAQSWKLFSLILSGFGFMKAGTIARKNFVEVAIDEVNKNCASSRTIHQLIRGLLESRRFEDVNKYIQEFTVELGFTSINNPYVDYMTMMHQIRPRVDSSATLSKSEEDVIFQALVRDKSVALVATAEIQSEYGEDIDSMDTVARVKFQGLEILPDKKLAGARCDITAYTEDYVIKFQSLSSGNATYLDFLDQVKIIVLKQKTRQKIGNNTTRNMTVWAPTFLTTATSGTLLLFDIARLEPAKIKLFGFNFYTSRHIYNSTLLNFFTYADSMRDFGLPKNWFKFSSERKNSAIIAAGFVSHDPRSDFLLVKNLYELSGLIDGTPEVLEILNLTADEYDARLEEMLGDW